MATGTVCYLNAGATSLAAGNWSDATGITAANAWCVINTGSQSITGGLTTTAGGFDILDIESGFSGNIGSSIGSLSIEGSTTYTTGLQISRLKYNASGGSLWYSANGAGTDKLMLFLQAGSGTSILTGAWTLREFVLDSGRCTMAYTVVSEASYEWLVSGGTVTFAYDSSATSIHNLTVLGGVVQLGRGVQTLLFVAGGTVIIDAGALTYAAITQTGGRVVVLNAGTGAATGITAYVLKGGELDLSTLQRPLIIGTMTHYTAGTVKKNNLLTITTNIPRGLGAAGLR